MREKAVLWCLPAVLAGVVLFSVRLGYIDIGFADILRIAAAKVTGNREWIADMKPIYPVVVFEVRLPRILTAAAVGAGLAVSGAVFQGILQNPLADPDTLGVSAGAAFGASLAILWNITTGGGVSIPMFAFAGAALTLLAVIWLASAEEGIIAGMRSTNLILSGIIVAAVLSAGISFLKYAADEQVAVIIFWLMGSFASKTWGDAVLTGLAVFAGTLVCMMFSRDLNLLSLGTRAAESMGVHAGRTMFFMLVAASLITAVCVSVSGIIGFVGLLVPHTLRLWTGPDNRTLIPAAFLAGAAGLVCADTVTRAVLPREVPVGVLTALIGGPFFCWVFRRSRRTGSKA